MDCEATRPSFISAVANCGRHSIKLEPQWVKEAESPLFDFGTSVVAKDTAVIVSGAFQGELSLHGTPLCLRKAKGSPRFQTYRLTERFG